VSLAEHPYAAFLHRVAKPARYVGGEHNQVVKDPASVRVRMALAFPDIYDIGMSHLGTKILYALLNKRPEFAAERVFCPWVDMERELRERGLPLLSLESASPLTAFDVVGFSLQYELTYTNVLTMMDLAGIPFRAADRDASHPLIVAGGPNATQPEALAPFVDVVLVGDAEEKLPEMLLRYAELRDAGLSRETQLVELAKLGGLYCPALYDTRVDERTGFLLVGAPLHEGVPERVERVILDDLNRFPFPDDAPVAAAEAIFDRMSVEIARGCTEGCRFCQAGMIYRPVRERDPEAIVDTLVRAVEKGGYDEASMTTLSTADYSCISPLIARVMEKLRPRKVSLSVASLRAYGLDEDTLDEIKSVRASGLTFAPEAGTQRMRDVINKNISDEDMERTAHRVFSRGWRRVKLYFMIGLPGENDEDVAGIMETGRRMLEIGRKYHGRKAGVTVSVSSHVPKPWTPFQWVAMDSLQEIERKQDLLLTLARRYRLEFRKHDPRASYLECVLGRGDRRMADVLESVWRRGARFDSWDDQLAWDAWMESLREHADRIPYDAYLGTIPVDAPLPWEHLDMQLERRFLETDYRRALRDKLSPPCGKPVGAQIHHQSLAAHEADRRILVCYNCGVACDMNRMREERGEFLTRLGAFRPRGEEHVPETETDAEAMAPPPAEPTAGKGAEGKVLHAGDGVHPGELSQAQAGEWVARYPGVPDRPKRGTPPHRFDQGEPVRYRLTFAKTGVQALTGHLDFVRTLPRVIRRAGIPMYYSEGFHPKPVMEFSPPLPLGVTGLREYVDVALAEEIAPEALVERLSAAAPQGLVILDAERLEPGQRKLSRGLVAADYLVRVEPGHLHGLAPDAVESAPARFLARDAVLLSVTRKRVPKQVDIRPSVEEVRWVEADALPEGVRPLRDARYLAVRVRLQEESHARPEEVASAVLGGKAEFEPPHIVRVRLVLQEASRAEEPAPEAVH